MVLNFRKHDTRKYFVRFAQKPGPSRSAAVTAAED